MEGKGDRQAGMVVKKRNRQHLPRRHKVVKTARGVVDEIPEGVVETKLVVHVDVIERLTEYIRRKPIVKGTGRDRHRRQSTGGNTKCRNAFDTLPVCNRVTSNAYFERSRQRQ